MISTDNLTFDILERLSKSRPDLKLTGHFARGTGGVDVDAVVRALDAVILQSALEPQAVDDAMVERGEIGVADALAALTAAIAREDRESQIKYQALATIAVNIAKSEPTAEFAVALKNWWEEEKVKIYPSRAALASKKETVDE